MQKRVKLQFLLCETGGYSWLIQFRKINFEKSPCKSSISVIYLILHITAGVYLYAEDFPYNFADLEQKFLCGGLNRLRYGCLLFLTCFSGKERGPSVSCLEASALFHFIGLFCRFRFGRRLFSCSAAFTILCVEATAQY